MRARGDAALIDYRCASTGSTCRARACASRRPRSTRRSPPAIARGAGGARARARAHRSPTTAARSPADARSPTQLGRRARLALARDRRGRPLRARRHGELSVLGADERRAGARSPAAAHRHGRADARRRAQSAGARRGASSPASTKSTASAAPRRSPRSPTAPRAIAPVAKIVGPGNAYVAAAKRRVFGVVGIDMIAGPSEVVVLADASADPELVAADLLAQAEHDEAAQSILITDDARLGDRRRRGGRGAARRPAARGDRRRELARLRRDHPRRRTFRRAGAGRPHRARASRDHRPRRRGAVGGDQQRRRDLPRAAHARGDRRLCRRLQPRAADGALGALLLGARRLDFVKRTSILKCDARSLATLGPAAVTLGEAEGLDAHARSVALRLGRDGAT